MAEGGIDESTSEPTGAFDGKHLYRWLREGEDWNEGLAPNDPDTEYSVNQHMRGHPKKQKLIQYQTQYISTCASLRAARAWAGLSHDPSSSQIVKIDVDKMEETNQIINLTDPIAQIFYLDGETMRNDANEFEVVLVKGHIKSDCLTLMNPSDDDNVDHITERIGLMLMCSFRPAQYCPYLIDIYDIPGPTGAFHGKPLYRCLREDEDWNEGLAPKNPYATDSVDQHVRGGGNTQYISTCASLRAARAWADLSHDPSSIQIVKIDGDKMEETNQIINLTDPNERILLLAGERIRNYSKHFEEVLVTGYITSDCLTLTNPWDDDDVDQITEGIVNLDMSLSI